MALEWHPRHNNKITLSVGQVRSPKIAVLKSKYQSKPKNKKASIVNIRMRTWIKYFKSYYDRSKSVTLKCNLTSTNYPTLYTAKHVKAQVVDTLFHNHMDTVLITHASQTQTPSVYLN